MERIKTVVRQVLSPFGYTTYGRPPFIMKSIRPPVAPKKALDARFFEPIELKASRSADADHFSADLSKNPIYQAWKTTPGGHKWLHYFAPYRDALAHFEGRPIRMLEIGIYKGGSQAMWRKALHPASLMVGIDIDPRCKQYENASKNVHVRIGDQSDQDFLAAVAREFGPFDFILDDGSHVCSHQIASFNSLFLAHLKDDGIYMVEDLHTNFWSAFKNTPASFVDIAKCLVDYMHASYWDAEMEENFRHGHDLQFKAVEVPRICTEVREIRFVDSVITIYKKRLASLPISVHL